MTNIYSLPRDVRLCLLRWLPPNSLATCATTCKLLYESAMDDALWKDICSSTWSYSNLGCFVKTHRECYFSRNGWLYLGQLPRTVMSTTRWAPSSSGRSGNRSERPPPLVTAFDADDSVTAIAMHSMHSRIVLHAYGDDLGKGVELANPTCVVRSLQLLRLSRGSTHNLRIVACTDNGLHGGILGVRDDLSVVPLWDLVSSSDNSVLAAPEECIWLGRAEDAKLLVRTSSCIVLRDIDANASLIEWRSSDRIRSMCSDPLSPNLITLGLRSSSDSKMSSHLAMVDFRVGSEAFRLCTHHELLFRIGAWRNHTCLTAHLHCKDVEAWDLRRASSRFNSNSRLSRDVPVARFHCSGNGPDFASDESHSMVACIAPGPPGTTFGAKVHLFGPGGMQVETVTTEIIIDSHYRKTVTRGVSLWHRSLSILADEQRILRYHIPV